MSCYSHSQRGATFVAPRTFSLRAVLSRVADRLRHARDRRRQRQELIDYLASDHRAARRLSPPPKADILRCGKKVAIRSPCRRG